LFRGSSLSVLNLSCFSVLMNILETLRNRCCGKDKRIRGFGPEILVSQSFHHGMSQVRPTSLHTLSCFSETEMSLRSDRAKFVGCRVPLAFVAALANAVTTLTAKSNRKNDGIISNPTRKPRSTPSDPNQPHLNPSLQQETTHA